MGSRVLALIVLALCACSSSTAQASPHTSHSTPQARGTCRTGPPEAGVWQPDRLKVLNPCQHAMGVVVVVQKEPDGDYHVWFRVDPGFESLLTAENHFQGKPALLAEITPDCPLGTNPANADEAARCPATDLEVPGPGDRIDIYGPWVIDLDHGWNEIHPVESIVISDAG